MGKLTIFMAIFNSKLLVYQRLVSDAKWLLTTKKWGWLEVDMRVCHDSHAVCATRNGYNSYHQYSQPLGLALHLLNVVGWDLKKWFQSTCCYMFSTFHFLDLVLDMFWYVPRGVNCVVHQLHTLSYINSPEQSPQWTKTSLQSQRVVGASKGFVSSHSRRDIHFGSMLGN